MYVGNDLSGTSPEPKMTSTVPNADLKETSEIIEWQKRDCQEGMEKDNEQEKVVGGFGKRG